jgi:hypothetical protein
MPEEVRVLTNLAKAWGGEESRAPSGIGCSSLPLSLGFVGTWAGSDKGEEGIKAQICGIPARLLAICSCPEYHLVEGAEKCGPDVHTAHIETAWCRTEQKNSPPVYLAESLREVDSLRCLWAVRSGLHPDPFPTSFSCMLMQTANTSVPLELSSRGSQR